MAHCKPITRGSLLRFHLCYGISLQVKCHTGSGEYMHLGHIAEEIQRRSQHLLVRGDDGRIAVNDGSDMLDFDPHWKDCLWFYEFFWAIVDEDQAQVTNVGGPD